MRNVKETMKKLITMVLAVAMITGSLPAGVYAKGISDTDLPVIGEEGEGSETISANDGSPEEDIDDTVADEATDDEITADDSGSTYAGYIPTSSDDASALAANQVTFNGLKWYIIRDDSANTTEKTVTLFAIDPFEQLSKFDDSSTDYGSSIVKSYLDGLMTGSGSFAGVAPAIVDLYLLSTGDAESLPEGVRKNYTRFETNRQHWWLRSPSTQDSDAVVSVQGNSGAIYYYGDEPDSSLGVRPALRLDLECVLFNGSSKTFSLNPDIHSVTITGGANATASGGSLHQTKLTGSMTTVTYTANEECHFNAFDPITRDGITVRRVSETTVTVSGTPTANVTITVPDAAGPPAYAPLIPKGSDNDEALAAKQVSFGGHNWYIIEDNSTSQTEGSLTLFAVGAIGWGPFNSDPWAKVNKYSDASIKNVVAGFTGENGDLSYVADAIKTVTVTTKGYNSNEIYDTLNNAKLYLLDLETVGKLSERVRGGMEYWLRSPGDGEENVCNVRKNGSINTLGQRCNGTNMSVRPALQLDLSKVAFISESKIFMPESGYRVSLTGGNNATVSGGNISQTGLKGAMTTVYYTADEGYHFEAFDERTDHGIKVTRVDDKTVTVSGTPTYNVSITIPDAVSGYSVTLSGGANATVSGGSISQAELNGAMIPVTYTANEGYAFAPFDDIADQDITVKRVDYKTVTVSGTPTTDVSIRIPDAVRVYSVTLTGGANATVSGGSISQNGLFGAMTTVTYTANEGARFPEFTDIEDHGITVKRVDEKTLTVSGTPTADVSITVPYAFLPAARISYSGTSVEYNSFMDAVASWKTITTGATLTLLRDVTASSNIRSEYGTEASPKILDLNGYGILFTGQEDGLTVVSGYTRLTDSSDTGITRYIVTDENGIGSSVSTEVPTSASYIPVRGGYMTGSKTTGVSIRENACFEMVSGTILANTNTYTEESCSGSGVLNEGTFIMNGGSITHNFCSNYGGGVANLGTFVMNGGSITYNKTNLGGGVANAGSFVINGGEISHNTAPEGGNAFYTPGGDDYGPVVAGILYAGKEIDGSDAKPVTPSLVEISEWNKYGYIRVVEKEFTYDPVDSEDYTGKPIQPEVKVYYRSTPLTKNRDYTIRFSNNTNAGTATFTITGKGNYKGSATGTFEIIPESMTWVRYPSLPSAVAYSKKAYTPVPDLSFNKKKLKKGVDFTVAYYANSDDAEDGKNAVTPKEPGHYYMVITGLKNFEGTKGEEFWICDKTQTPVSKLTVSKIRDQQYTGSGICPKPVVKKGRTVLKEGVDYRLDYHGNDEIGTAGITIIGIGSYVGMRGVPFKIKGIPMSKVTITGIPKSVVYDGKAKKPEIKLTYKPDKNKPAQEIKWVDEEDKKSEEALGSGDVPVAPSAGEVVNCHVSFKNNIETGTATVTLTGVGGCSGTVKKTFKITPIDAASNKDSFRATVVSTPKYAKSGAKPKVKVEYRNNENTWITLEEGKDYKLSCSNNKKVSDGTGRKAPTVTVTGIGHFKGSNANLKCSFAIGSAKLSDAAKVSAKDLVYKNKAGNWKSAVTVIDTAGKKLKAGTDYEKAVKYYKVEGGTRTELRKTDKLNPGDVVKAVVKAKGPNYTDEAETTYRILSPGHDISTLTVVISPKEYTGSEVTIKPEDITFKSNKKAVSGVSFEIDETTYKNNVNSGKATVVIRGTNEWGGAKTVTFNIGAKGFFW